MFLYHHHQQQQHNDHFHHHSYCHHSHGAVSYLKTFIMFKRSKKFCFMELKGSLPRSQKPKVGPYSEPDGSILLLRFILTLSSHLRLSLPNNLFISGFRPSVIHIYHLISTSEIWTSYLNYESHHYVIFPYNYSLSLTSKTFFKHPQTAFSRSGRPGFILIQSKLFTFSCTSIFRWRQKCIWSEWSEDNKWVWIMQ